MLSQLTIATAALGANNGYGITPPRGWRSWNSYGCQDSSNTTFVGGDIISDAAMRRAMHAVIDATRTVRGKPTTLASLGFSWVSMDDGWQQCNCSTHQDIDPTLPTCSIADCRGGRCSWHDPVTHMPMVNAHRFGGASSMKALTDYGHSLGLKVGSYLNNCICMESGHGADEHPMHYAQDVQFIVDNGFDGVKIDNCGSSHNVTLYAELFNQSGRAIRIEDCHTWPIHPDVDPTNASNIICPMNMFRSGGDIKADFGSIVAESFGTVQWSDRAIPLSRPGCWAYPDMMQIGNFKGPEPTRSHEEQTHFGLWSIISAPLVLGFDMGNASTMDRVWSTITNPDALAINLEWAGHPGTLVKAYPATTSLTGVKMLTQGPCDGSATRSGWTLTSTGKLLAPAADHGGGSSPPLCLLGASTVSNTPQLTCVPATTRSGVTQCGGIIANCSDASGVWRFSSDMMTGGNSSLQFVAKAGAPAKCLAVRPGLASTMRTSENHAPNPLAWTSGLTNCPASGKPLPNTSTITLNAKGELVAGYPGASTATCLGVSTAPGVQLWSKPLMKGRVAVLLLNPLDLTQTLTVPLVDISGNLSDACAGGRDGTTTCTVRDVWTQSEAPLAGGTITATLAPHQSAYFLITPPPSSLPAPQVVRLISDVGSSGEPLTEPLLPGAQCTAARDCSLNGRCVPAGLARKLHCVCEPAWSGASDCSVLSFTPGKRASGYRPHAATSWGGGGYYDNSSGLWLLWASEMVGGCGMAAWTTNSHTIRASSPEPLGLYTREAEQFPVWSHESAVTRGPRGEWIAFMSYNVPQTRAICTGCVGGLTNTTCVEPKQHAAAAAAAPVGERLRLSDWDPSFMSWAPANGARTPEAWSTPVLVGSEVVQMDTNLAAVVDSDGRLVGMWRDHHRNTSAAGTKSKSTIHLVTASDWKDNATYVFEHDDLLFNSQLYPGGVEDPFIYKDVDGNYHALFHLLYSDRGLDPACVGRGTKVLGGHAFSPVGDGRNWTFTGVAFDGNVSFLDGADIVCNGDRPKLLFDKDGVTPLALTTAAGACRPGGWCDAVPGLDSDQAYTLLRPLATS